jgi:hypothetical protein
VVRVVGLALFGWLSRWGLTLSCLGLLVSHESGDSLSRRPRRRFAARAALARSRSQSSLAQVTADDAD